MIKKTALTLALALTGIAHAATIDTLSLWDGSNSVSAWGEFNTATYGQTFTTGSAATLMSFTFAMTAVDENFRAYVGAWDGSKASSILWSSPVLNADTGFPGFDTITIELGSGLALAAHTQYVAFFSTSGLHDGVWGTNSWGYLNADVYDGGGFVFFNNGNDAAALTASAGDGAQWWGQTSDLAFSVDLVSHASVPEPGTALLAGLGLLAAAARRRNKAAVR